MIEKVWLFQYKIFLALCEPERLLLSFVALLSPKHFSLFVHSSIERRECVKLTMPGFVTKQSVAVTRLVVHSVPLFFPFQRPPPFAKALTGRTHTSGFIHEVDRENTFTVFTALLEWRR